MCLAWDIGNGDNEVNTLTCTTRPGGTATERRDGTCTHGPQTKYATMATTVAKYAAADGQEIFLTDFAAAWQKLMELTSSTLVNVGTAQSSSSCTDETNAYMDKEGKTCATWTWGITNNCKNSDTWTAAKTCQLSCYNAGLGYAGDDCGSLLAQEDSWEEKVHPF